MREVGKNGTRYIFFSVILSDSERSPDRAHGNISPRPMGAMEFVIFAKSGDSSAYARMKSGWQPKTKISF